MKDAEEEDKVRQRGSETKAVRGDVQWRGSGVVGELEGEETVHTAHKHCTQSEG